MDKLLLMTVHHKNDPFIEISKKYFFPIQVGKKVSDFNLGINSDDSGENISIYNKKFCELTACYWAWKNYNAEYIGLMHYRRIFSEKNFFSYKIISKFSYYVKSLIYSYIFKNTGHFYGNTIKIKNMDKIQEISSSFIKYLNDNLYEYDIYLPKKILLKYLNMEQHFIISHNTDDWLIFKNLIAKYYPFLIEAFDIVSKSKEFYAYNMFIMKKNIFDDYMNILFDIFFKMDKLVDFKNKSSYQKRLFG
ncbi:MAG: DUF4422 domain-containing protein, partial [Elusimicrobiota bacterium]